MFEIGNSLREARLRQGLDFPEAEQATKIRSKYLRALEDERFELLPAQTYVKGFLRTYAEFLGLDGQLYVDEYNSRFVVGEDETPSRPRRSSARPQGDRHRRVESRVVLLALLAIALVTALVIAAWKSGDGGQETAIPNLAKSPPAAQPAVKRKRRTIRVARLLVTATRGNSWLEVHAGSATGKLLFQGTLEQGQRQRFVRRRIWLNVGAVENLDLKLNGKPVALPARAAPHVLIVTARGVAPVSAGA